MTSPQGSVQEGGADTVGPHHGSEPANSWLGPSRLPRNADRFSILESLGVAVYATDENGLLTYFNPAAAALWGWEPTLGQQYWCGSWRLYNPDGSSLAHDACPMAICLREARPIRGRWAWAATPDGRRFAFAPFPVPLFDADGTLTGAVNTLVEISELRASEPAQARSETLFRAAQEVSPEGFAVLEPVTRPGQDEPEDFAILSANPAAARLLRRNAGIPPGAKLAQVLDLPASGVSEVLRFLTFVHASGRTRARVLHHRRGTEEFWFRLRAASLGREIAVSFENVTARRRAERLLRHQASHDDLTGLANRRGFQRALDRSMPATTGLLLLDLDQFKRVNDTLGHAGGDALLVEVAARLRAAVSDRDLVARLGGDEFAILLRGDVDRASTESLARRVEASLAAPTTIEGQPVQNSASIGIAVGPEDGATPSDLLKAADLALYRAKAEGSGRSFRFEPLLARRALARRGIEVELRHAISAGELEPHYQPAVDARTGRVVGVEALLRWRHPERGLLGPGGFIGVAEDSGLIEVIGEAILVQATRDAVLWPDPLTLAVNVSPLQLRRPGFDRGVDEALAASGLDPRRLRLEVTESVRIDDDARPRASLVRLRERGVAIALDDFGTGFSSLSLLLRFPFDVVKIDSAFVRGCETMRDRAAVVRALASMCNDLGAVSVAEGVETDAEWQAVRSLGCAEVQGWLFGRAVTAEDLPAVVGAINEAASACLGKSAIA